MPAWNHCIHDRVVVSKEQSTIIPRIKASPQRAVAKSKGTTRTKEFVPRISGISTLLPTAAPKTVYASGNNQVSNKTAPTNIINKTNQGHNSTGHLCKCSWAHKWNSVSTDRKIQNQAKRYYLVKDYVVEKLVETPVGPALSSPWSSYSSLTSCRCQQLSRPKQALYSALLAKALDAQRGHTAIAPACAKPCIMILESYRRKRKKKKKRPWFLWIGNTDLARLRVLYPAKNHLSGHERDRPCVGHDSKQCLCARVLQPTNWQAIKKRLHARVSQKQVYSLWQECVLPFCFAWSASFPGLGRETGAQFVAQVTDPALKSSEPTFECGMGPPQISFLLLYSKKPTWSCRACII